MLLRRDRKFALPAVPGCHDYQTVLSLLCLGKNDALQLSLVGLQVLVDMCLADTFLHNICCCH